MPKGGGRDTSKLLMDRSVPGRVGAMRMRLHDWYDEVDAKFLVARPDGPQPWRPEEPARK